MSNFPTFARVRQFLPSAPLADIAGTVRSQVQNSGVLKQRRPGSTIAIGVGSRGIASLSVVIRALVEELVYQGFHPFIFPAMGSHGGGTESGQRDILSIYGITEESMGCPINASMEVVQVGTTPSGVPVYCCKPAFESDGIVLANRIKVHTDFHGPTESGLTKMLAIGLGKKVGAEKIHEHGVRGLRYDIPEIAAVQIERSPLWFGLAILEDGCHQVHSVRLLKPEQILAEEPKLLEISRAMTPRLPIDRIDLLIVDELGKEISGSGLDTNVIGRLYIEGEPEPELPEIKVILVRRLSRGTHGNAAGIGLADIVTEQLIDAVDFEATNINVITSGFLLRGRVPTVEANDFAAIRTALALLVNKHHCPHPRIARIKNTLSLSEFEVSENLLPELERCTNVDVVETGLALQFDDQGSLQ